MAWVCLDRGHRIVAAFASRIISVISLWWWNYGWRISFCSDMSSFYNLFKVCIMLLSVGAFVIRVVDIIPTLRYCLTVDTDLEGDIALSCQGPELLFVTSTLYIGLFEYASPFGLTRTKVPSGY
jgi:hypothetical protein